MDVWQTVFETSFQRFDRPTEGPLWHEEIKRIVPDWASEDDRTVNAYICRVLRWVSVADVVPRADGAKTSAKYNARDIAKWVRLKRKNDGYKSPTQRQSAGSSMNTANYAKTVCKWIDKFLAEGNKSEAVSVVRNPCGNVEVCNDLGTNRGPSISEIASIANHNKRIGFNPHEACNELYNGSRDIDFAETAMKTGL